MAQQWKPVIRGIFVNGVSMDEEKYAVCQLVPADAPDALTVQPDTLAAGDTRLWCAVCGDQLEDTSVCEVCYDLQPREQDAPAPQPLDAPDSPGWWAFEGSKWEPEPILPEGYKDWEAFEDSWEYDERKIQYRDVKGQPFQTVLLVRYTRQGETVIRRKEHGPYHGDPILGYLHSHSWNHYLHTPDHLTGKWYRLTMPWEQPAPAQESSNE